MVTNKGRATAAQTQDPEAEFKLLQEWFFSMFSQRNGSGYTFRKAFSIQKVTLPSPVYNRIFTRLRMWLFWDCFFSVMFVLVNFEVGKEAAYPYPMINVRLTMNKIIIAPSSGNQASP